MKVLVFGATGMLGHKLVQVFSPEFETYGTVRGSILEYADLPCLCHARLVGGIDANEEGVVWDLVRSLKPDVVVNAVGLVKQHQMGADEGACRAINEFVPKRIAAASEAAGARYIGISTDCVFSGRGGNYSEENAPDAEDAYGLSKLRGEVSTGNSLTVRTSIIGRELSGAHGLLEWFLSNRGRTIKGFSNAIFSGFPTVVLAEILKQVIIDGSNLRGLYHVASEPISKLSLLESVNEAFDVRAVIEEDDSVHVNRSLDGSKFRRHFGFTPASWPEMVERMREDAEDYEKWRR